MKTLNDIVFEQRKYDPEKDAGRFAVTADDVPPLKDIKGIKAEKNDSGGLYEVEAPTDDKALDVEIPEEQWSNNLDALSDNVFSRDPEENNQIFIAGKAGWGKTSIIKDWVHRLGFSVITVYLGEAVKEDLGGIPIPVELQREDGKLAAGQNMAMPMWAAHMYMNPDTKFLLFFDEMNHATPDVFGELMHIILDHTIAGRKFHNYFVMGAGNLKEENEAGITDINTNVALKSRLKPIINWECDWSAAWAHLAEKHHDEFSEEYLSALSKYVTLFDNPRELEQKFMVLYVLGKRKAIRKQAEDPNYIKSFNVKKKLSVEGVYRQLKGLAREDLTKTEEDNLKLLAEITYNFILDADEAPKSRASRRTGKKRIDEGTLRTYKDMMRYGYYAGPVQQVNGKNYTPKYGVSRENIVSYAEFDEELIAEDIERIVKKLEADGVKFKFETDAEWKKAGYLDPFEE